MALIVGYDGTDFHGSQVQPGLRTVQQELDTMVRRVAPGSGGVALAGRTDRGAHAVGQVASVDVTWRRPAGALRDALNAVAPDDIVVARAVDAPAGFHARHDARWREYRYRIVVAPAPPVLERRFVWWRRNRLDADLAATACARFVGRKSFGTFAAAGKSQSLSSAELTRTVRECEWSVTSGPGDSGLYEERHTFRVVANGFLPQMVRNMVSAVQDVARGAQPAEWVDNLLAANDRRALGDAAPPHGLVLWRVEYEVDWT
jgi:tRNA pseudouridine38-40 synthase